MWAGKDLEQKSRPPDLIREKALVGNGFGTQSNCPYFRSRPYIFSDMNIATVRSILPVLIKVVWGLRAV